MISKHVVKASKAKCLELSRVFRSIDSKQDGKLDKDEFAEALDDLAGALQFSQEQVEDLFDKLDFYKDGSVEFSEFVAQGLAREE